MRPAETLRVPSKYFTKFPSGRGYGRTSYSGGGSTPVHSRWNIAWECAVGVSGERILRLFVSDCVLLFGHSRSEVCSQLSTITSSFYRSILILNLSRDSDFPTGPERHGSASLWKSEYRVGFAWSLIAQFLYCGNQEIISRFSGAYLGQGTSESYSTSDISHGLFIAGRFIAALAMLILRPRWILLASLIGCIISTTFALITTDLKIGIGMIQLIWFLEVNMKDFSRQSFFC